MFRSCDTHLTCGSGSASLKFVAAVAYEVFESLMKIRHWHHLYIFVHIFSADFWIMNRPRILDFIT